LDFFSFTLILGFSETYLSNRVFKNYADILDACQDAWRKLLDETVASPPSPRAIG
jgi:hypothetical protein